MYGAEVCVDLKSTPNEMIASLKVLQNKIKGIDSGDQDEVVEETIEVLSEKIYEFEQMDPGAEQEVTFYFDFPLTQDVADAEDVDLENALVPFAASMKSGELSVTMEWEDPDSYHLIEIEAANGKVSIEKYDHQDEYDDD